MKRVILLVLIFLVGLVGMIGISSAATDPAMQPIITQLKNIQQSLDTISHAVSALQSTTNPTTEVPTLLLEPINAVDPAKAEPIPFTLSDRIALLDFSGSASVNQVEPKMYYLTKDSLDGGDAIKACNSGFHMASISEIQDPSNLQYANRSTTVYDSLVDDPSLGPPSNHVGWVRSGVYPPSGFVYDCNDFSNEHDIQLGTTAALHSLSVNAGPGQSASHPTTWWHAALHPCTQPKPVWCVEDPE